MAFLLISAEKATHLQHCAPVPKETRCTIMRHSVVAIHWPMPSPGSKSIEFALAKVSGSTGEVTHVTGSRYSLLLGCISHPLSITPGIRRIRIIPRPRHSVSSVILSILGDVQWNQNVGAQHHLTIIGSGPRGLLNLTHRLESKPPKQLRRGH